ncbi:hypothetical protein HYW94_03065 [Candidatus Uhrbacteria bacterium]|nr:hypothetical protein [Candidatus Uhrbacteria bacterium]
MRDVITISLPTKTRSIIKKRLKERGFRSMSEYMRYLLDQDTDVISQDELLAIAKEADRDYKNNLLKKRSSLRELL